MSDKLKPCLLIKFVFKHNKTGDIKEFELTINEIQDKLEDELYEMLVCDCEPVGESNVIECNCEDYLEDFILQKQGTWNDRAEPKQEEMKGKSYCETFCFHWENLECTLDKGVKGKPCIIKNYHRWLKENKYKIIKEK